ILTEYTSYLVQEPNQVVVRPMLLQAPAPQDQAGAEAVRRSRAEKALVGSAQLSAVTVSDGAEVDASSASRSQRIGGRVFVWRDRPWTDIAHGDLLRVVGVVAFRGSYFALLSGLTWAR